MLVDTHCHLHDREFFSEEQELAALESAEKNGIKKVICIGTSQKDSLTAQEFANKHENVYWTYGIHPNEAKRLENGSSQTTSFTSILTEFDRHVSATDLEAHKKARSQSLVAVGEVGLDYHYEGYDRDAQIKLFEAMLQLAIENNLPVSFHVREAFADFLPIVKNFPGVRGVVHSFTDSKKTLKRIINETDFYIGVNGLATYSTLPLPPLERIVLETDAPFLAPIPHRGKTNQPAYIADIAKWLANRLEVTFTEVEEKTTDNAIDIFNIS